jgi:DnaK suppressor protein
MKGNDTAPGKMSQGHVPREWAWHHAVLLSLRDQLMDDRDAQREHTLQPLPQDINDQADCGTDEFDHDLAFSILSQEESALQEVDAAIRRIEAGTYGVCEETGEPIPNARLRAVPWTRYQRRVQERLEREGLVKQARLAQVADIRGPLRGTKLAP